MSGVRTIGIAAVIVCVPTAAAQTASRQDAVPRAGSPRADAAFELTVENIMRGPELVGEPPRGVEWTDDGEWVYFRWKPGGAAWHEDASLYRVRAAGGEPERLSDETADSLGMLLAEGDLSPEEDARVVAYRGDLYVIDRETLERRRLTETAATERSPVFGRDGRTIYFIRDDDRGGSGSAAGNLFALDDGSVRQLTDIRRGSEPEEEEPEGLKKFLRDQQEELFEHIRREADEREEREARREAREATEPETVWIDEDERLVDIAVEPGARWALLAVGREAPNDETTMVPDYVTDSGYTEPLRTRSKVGDAQDRMRVGLLTIETGEAVWLKLLPDSDDAAAPNDDRYGDLADGLARVRFLGWNEDGTRGLLAAVGYSFKDQWLYTIDARTAELALITHDHDDAWIGGPCSMWTSGCAGWMPDGGSVWFLSERDGHSHLYTVAADGDDVRRLTRGDWAVQSVEISPDEDRFHLTVSEHSPFDRHFVHMGLEGGERTRITSEPGFHDVSVAPDGDRLAVVHSFANRPPELYLMPNEPGAAMERITTSPAEEWSSYDWIVPEIVRFEARDGERVPARVYRPEDVGERPNGAGVIFVHGAGYLHNVHNGWSSYYREYMFHHLLASRGYTVLDIDYRGSAGYGRDWRTAIYRHMGGQDLTDQVDGARYLAEREGVDPERIGIYGGSYGGFITLMALFKHPETFAAGAALRSVTDWAHYNHWYTARILNLPQNDDEAYRRSSPIYFAEGLEDPLLILHGMIDRNVHFQDVVRLVQRLIELGKTDWELAVFPVEGHGFVEPASWTDEYRRILELFERHLRDTRTTSDEE